jgi:hypothetical protein
MCERERERERCLKMHFYTLEAMIKCSSSSEMKLYEFYKLRSMTE